MGDLSEHFDRSEFACKCGCGFDTVDHELILVLEDLRRHFGAPVSVTSGCRCMEHNAAVGGAARSRHVTGKAADVVVRGIAAREVYQYLTNKYDWQYGIGAYNGRTHIDVRSDVARWVG